MDIRIGRSGPMEKVGAAPSRTGDQSVPLLRIPVRKLFVLLVVAVCVLFLVSFVIGIGHVITGFSRGGLFFVEEIFGMNHEANIPTWFSSTALFLVALALALIAAIRYKQNGGNARYWALLVLVFVYLSLDEAAVLHEKSGMFLPDVLEPKFLYGWTVIAAGVVLLFGLLFLRFFLALPGETRSLFAMATSLYIGGALGLEMVAGVVNTTLGKTVYDVSIWRVLLTHLEELMELGGILLFLYMCLGYIAKHIGPLQLEIAIVWGQAAQRDRNLGSN